MEEQNSKENVEKPEDKIIQERKEKLKKLFKGKYDWLIYICLAIIVWLSIYIRTLPMKINSATGKPGLWDITLNNWTLGPDLDPFLFLRWAKYIVAHGTLMAVDTMRYIPLHLGTADEMRLLPYSIAWFHKLATFFGSTSVEYSAIIYPVFMFTLTVIAFFLLVRKIFVDQIGQTKAGIIALISSFFLTVLPSLLPRTIAGIPEKESSAFFYMFLTFYFFLCAWKAKKTLHAYIFAALAAIATAAMALVWGGVIYIFITLGIAMFLAFFLGQITKERFAVYSIWLFLSFAIMYPFSTRYTPAIIISSTTTLIAIAAFLLILLHFIIFKTKIKHYVLSKPSLAKIPPQVFTFAFFCVAGLVVSSIFFGPSFILDKFNDIKGVMVTPITTRLGVTVAENRQPFFAEWANSFGPSFLEFAQAITLGVLNFSDSTKQFFSQIPLFFWLFFFGSVYLLFIMLKEFELKKRAILTFSYFVFLVCLIFSRYSSSSQLNGTNGISLFVYILGFLVLLACFGFYYYKYHKENKEEKLKNFDFGWLLLLALFFLSIVSARGSVRTIMVLVPSASVLVAYFAVSLTADALKIKETFGKWIVWILVAFVLSSAIFSGIHYYGESKSMAQSYIPSAYTQQWQKAMAWVRENTPQDAVFGHWWDYGYWLQSIGNRATVLDGGNAIPYWDYLMGRHGLTTPNMEDALEFLYSHNTTHFLIDSSDIGKYAAFSSIGSNVEYDRRSWISTFVRDDKKAQETKNSTILFYAGGTPLDDDLVYEANGTKIYLPAGNAALAAVTIEMDRNASLAGQPNGMFYYQGKIYTLPLRYVYINKKLIDFKFGVEGGAFFMARLIQDSNGVRVEKNSALLYLSNRTVKSQLARLYLYNEENPYFKLVHSEDDFVVAQLKAKYGFDEDFVIYGDIRGPIKIWEINYPSGMKVNPDYLKTSYPDVNLSIAR